MLGRPVVEFQLGLHEGAVLLLDLLHLLLLFAVLAGECVLVAVLLHLILFVSYPGGSASAPPDRLFKLLLGAAARDLAVEILRVVLEGLVAEGAQVLGLWCCMVVSVIATDRGSLACDAARTVATIQT